MRFFYISFFFISTTLFANELVFTCENNYSYKLIEIKNKQQAFYKSNKDEWTEIKTFNITDNELVLFIPNLEYLGCSDKSLPICKYSIRINNFTQKRPSVTEVVLNDCFIGTMGCNEYKEGLELNQNFCRLN